MRAPTDSVVFSSWVVSQTSLPTPSGHSGKASAMTLFWTTVDEVKASARAFARLVGEPRGELEAPERPDPLTDALVIGPALKAAGQRALVAALHGRPDALGFSDQALRLSS